MIRLGIGLPAYRGTLASGHAAMWTQIGAMLNRPEIKEKIEVQMFVDIDMNGIDNARNALLMIARHHKIDWLLMTDSDTWSQPAQPVIEMILDADAEGAGLVGAPVITRGVNAPINVYRFVEIKSDGQKMVRVEPYPRAEWPEYNANSPLVSVGAIGAAMIAIHIPRSKDLCFEFVNRDGVHVSEDINFCKGMIELGERVMMDPRVQTFHVNKPDLLVYNPNG